MRIPLRFVVVSGPIIPVISALSSGSCTRATVIAGADVKQCGLVQTRDCCDQLRAMIASLFAARRARGSDEAKSAERAGRALVCCYSAATARVLLAYSCG